MDAFVLIRHEDQATLTARALDIPTPGPAELLIKVHAAGVTPTELLWYPSTHTKNGAERTFAVPGHEFSGTVAAVGADVRGFCIGDAVFGMNDWFADGATAEYCVANAGDVIRKPSTISHTAAAAIPIAALTAWEGLFDRAKMQRGEHVLVLGAAGSVGLYAVQLAVRSGCRVTASASCEDAATLKQLGCHDVLEYRSTRFEDHVRDVDVVFDAVGGDSLLRARTILTSTGRMVTIAADAEGSEQALIKDAFFIVERSSERLGEIATLVERGELRNFVKAVLPLRDAPQAYAGESIPRGLGKLVLEAYVVRTVTSALLRREASDPEEVSGLTLTPWDGCERPA